MAGAVNENVFQAWLAYTDSLNFSRKGFDQAGDKAMAVFHFDSHLMGSELVSHYRGVDAEATADALR
jgi:hypothetical protein